MPFLRPSSSPKRPYKSLVVEDEVTVDSQQQQQQQQQHQTTSPSQSLLWLGVSCFVMVACIASAGALALFRRRCALVQQQQNPIDAARQEQQQRQCVGYERELAKYIQAWTLWQDEACYDFLAMGPHLDQPTVVKVREGAVVTDNASTTMSSLLEYIHDTCIAHCSATNDDKHAPEAPHLCQVEYSADGHPVSIYIDHDGLVEGDEFELLIADYAVVECQQQQQQQQPPQGMQNNCVDFETVANDLTVARDTWQEHACYDYTVVNQSFGNTQHGTAFVVQVRDNVVVSSGSDDFSMTMTELLDYIERECVTRCMQEESLSSLSHRCDVSFSPTQGYPTSVLIDVWQHWEDDEEIWSITDLVVMNDCDQQQQQQDTTLESSSSSSPKCEGFEQVQEGLEQHRTKWAESSPLCYTYIYEDLSDDNASSTVRVTVENNVVVDAQGSGVTMTLSNLFEDLQQECVTACLDGSPQAAHACRVEYDFFTGRPWNVFVDRDATVKGEEDFFAILAFEEIPCST